MGKTLIKYPVRAKTNLNIPGSATWDDSLDILDCKSPETISQEILHVFCNVNSCQVGYEGRPLRAIYNGLFNLTEGNKNGFANWDEIREIISVSEIKFLSFLLYFFFYFFAFFLFSVSTFLIFLLIA